MSTQVLYDTQAQTLAEGEGDSLKELANGDAEQIITPFSDEPALKQYLAANKPVDWFSAGYLEAEYTFYAIHTTYQTDLGLQAAPSTAPRAVTTTGTTNSQGQSTTQTTNPEGPDLNNIVRVRRPITTKTVSWTAQRLTAKPLLPHWNTGSSNEKLLSRTISARNPLQGLNSKVWEVSGVYVYAFKAEPFVTIDLVEYFVLPAAMSAAENSQLGVALHAYTQGDFSFVPLDAAWIPVDAPLNLQNPVGYNSRTGTPDSQVTLEIPIALGLS